MWHSNRDCALDVKWQVIWLHVQGFLPSTCQQLQHKASEEARTRVHTENIYPDELRCTGTLSLCNLQSSMIDSNFRKNNTT